MNQNEPYLEKPDPPSSSPHSLITITSTFRTHFPLFPCGNCSLWSLSSSHFTVHSSNAITTTLQSNSPTSTHSSGTSHFHFLSIGSSFFFNQIFVFYLFFLYPFDQFINFHKWVIPILR